MSSKAIKVSESTYSFLKKKAQERDTSIKEVVDRMASERDISEYAGSWDMSNQEQERIKKSRDKMWDRWDIDN